MEWFRGKTSIAGIQISNWMIVVSGHHCNLAHLQLYALSRSDSLFRVVFVIRALVSGAIVSVFPDRAQD